MTHAPPDFPSLNDQVHRYLAKFDTENDRISSLLKMMPTSSHLTDRKTLPGHITASGIVLKDHKILMILHPFLRKWLQPGGHVEPQESPLQAAIREVSEETGLPVRIHAWHQQHLMPIDIDVHAIPENPSKNEPTHLHFDFRYILRTSAPDTSKNIGDHQCEWLDIISIK